MTAFVYLFALLVPMSLTMGIINLSSGRRFSNKVKRLFAQGNPSETKIYSEEILAGLPEPVQRYFKRALKNGQPYIQTARLQHNGKFRTGPDKKWAVIKGEEYFTTGRPGFIWKGKTKLFTAEDSFIAGSGNLIVWLFSFIPIVNGHGVKYTQGELLRWLGEGVWFPTALLPDKNLQWSAIDDYTARLDFRYEKIHVYYRVTFNEIGEIIRLETKRFMGAENLETWIGKLSNYSECDGMCIPTILKAGWKTDAAEFNYAIFRLTEIEYDKPEKF